ncbi:MAG: AAA family ATPase [Nitrososphaerota archaeon]|jgi:cobyric acid synthase|nr:AAA family ATPase [Nitrososphaerota archaeon]
MILRHKIGLVYISGALPCFENFGNLPTNLVCADAQVEGKPASEVLDMLIIPGGSLVESASINPTIAKEITKMAQLGKYVLGVCSGFQVLAKQIDIGRLSTSPITRKGLGLLDAEFKPLVCTDRVWASVVDKSFLTQQTDQEVSGFHCHTYGQTILHSDARPILITHAKRVNYKKNPQDLISGVTNKEGNIAGVFIHGLIDQNPSILQNILTSLDINSSELIEIQKANTTLLKNIQSEIGISTNIRQQPQINQPPKLILITALGSGSGKTFLVTGIAGALKKQGYKVGVLKIGGDIRDTVSSLYLTKEPLSEYSSIKIGESGWTPLEQAIPAASQTYNFLIVEGAMSAFTGLLNENYNRPMSTAEVAAALGASTVIVVGCDKEGIEGALINTLNYIKTLQSLNVKVRGVILNKLRVSYITQETKQMIQQTLRSTGVELLGMVPRLDLEARGMIPEIEIRYEDFGTQALQTAEKSLTLDLITQIATPPKITKINYEKFVAKFKNLITNYMLHASEATPTHC